MNRFDSPLMLDRLRARETFQAARRLAPAAGIRPRAVAAQEARRRKSSLRELGDAAQRIALSQE